MVAGAADYRLMPGRRNHPEDELQRAVIGMFRVMLPPTAVWWHNPSGMKAGSKYQPAILKGLGWKPGLPDLMIFWASELLCIELKAPGRPAKASIEQQLFMNRLEEMGAHVTTENSVEGVERFLRRHIPLRGKIAA